MIKRVCWSSVLFRCCANISKIKVGTRVKLGVAQARPRFHHVTEMCKQYQLKKWKKAVTVWLVIAVVQQDLEMKQKHAGLWLQDDLSWRRVHISVVTLNKTLCWTLTPANSKIQFPSWSFGLKQTCCWVISAFRMTNAAKPFWFHPKTLCSSSSAFAGLAAKSWK